MIDQRLIELTNYILTIHDPVLFEKERKRIGKMLAEEGYKYIHTNLNDTTTNGGEDQ